MKKRKVETQDPEILWEILERINGEELAQKIFKDITGKKHEEGGGQDKTLRGCNEN